MEDDDEIVTVLSIHFSEKLSPHLHIHQFPLLTRPLQTPPSAADSGKRIKARIKPTTRRIEVHVPADTRPEVWNEERGKELGIGRLEDDRERNQSVQAEGVEPRLSEIRMQSEEIAETGIHMLGIVRDGQLHLHPISQTHQLRPTLTYLDVLSKKNKRSRAGDDSDSDDGPPPDPDEPAPAPAPKKERKIKGEAKEVQVAARKVDDKGVQPLLGGLSVMRREMLSAIRAEEDEKWQDLEFCDGESESAGNAFDAVFSRSDEILECKTNVTTFLKSIEGL